jgi:hypothetical protein
MYYALMGRSAAKVIQSGFRIYEGNIYDKINKPNSNEHNPGLHTNIN